MEMGGMFLHLPYLDGLFAHQTCPQTLSWSPSVTHGQTGPSDGPSPGHSGTEYRHQTMEWNGATHTHTETRPCPDGLSAHQTAHQTPSWRQSGNRAWTALSGVPSPGHSVATETKTQLNLGELMKINEYTEKRARFTFLADSIMPFPTTSMCYIVPLNISKWALNRTEEPRLILAVFLDSEPSTETFSGVSLRLVFGQVSLVVPAQGTLEGGEGGERERGRGREKRGAYKRKREK